MFSQHSPIKLLTKHMLKCLNNRNRFNLIQLITKECVIVFEVILNVNIIHTF